jgi:hypothetical protein
MSLDVRQFLDASLMCIAILAEHLLEREDLLQGIDRLFEKYLVKLL